MKKIIGIVLIGTVIVSSSVFAIDGRSDGETKSDASAGGSPYVPVPVGMAINEKGVPIGEPRCKPGCRWNRRVKDCRCATDRIITIPGTNPVSSCDTTEKVLSYYETEEEKKLKSKEDVYVWKVTTKKKSEFGAQSPGIQVVMSPTELAKDRNLNSVKCACGTDVRGKDQGACDRICDFLKNNTNRTVCSNNPSQDVKSPRDAASGLATGRRSASVTGHIGPDMEPDTDVLQMIDTGPCKPPYLCLDISLERKGWDGTVKGITETSALSSPRDPASGLATGKRTMGDTTGSNAAAIDRDPASGLPTGKRQHKPITIRVSTDDQDCDGSDDDCDARIIIEADTDGDGEREPLLLNGLPPMQPALLKEKPKTGTGSTGEGKKEYVGHVTLMK